MNKRLLIRSTSLVAIFAGVLVAGLAVAQSGPATTTAAAAPTERKIDMNLTIGPGDLLDIVVYDVPELVLKTRVTDDGKVHLPLVGELVVANKTVAQFQTELSQQLIEKELVLQPQVSVLVAEFATQGISVLGEVQQPGVYPLMGPHRLSDALAAAGGLTTKAARTVKIVHKTGTDDAVMVSIPSDLSNTNNLQENPALQPGDTITVGKAGVVYVVGEVMKPGGFLLENNTQLSVLQAIALAQGTTKFARTKESYIVRRTGVGMSEIPVPLDKILEGKDSDRMLLPDDIVFVPVSRSKTMGKRAADAAVAASVAAAIYVSRL